MSKQNCREVKKCGREPGGAKVNELGICPVAVEIRMNGINNGKNGGRCCRAISGTFYGGKVQGTFTQKLTNCMKRKFYIQVRDEEGTAFIYTDNILPK